MKLSPAQAQKRLLALSRHVDRLSGEVKRVSLDIKRIRLSMNDKKDQGRIASIRQKIGL